MAVSMAVRVRDEVSSAIHLVIGENFKRTVIRLVDLVFHRCSLLSPNEKIFSIGFCFFALLIFAQNSITLQSNTRTRVHELKPEHQILLLELEILERA
jgi:hypothetical protein